MDFDGIPHKPVMLAEVLEFIHPQEGEWVFVDCTVGYGGHSEAVAREMKPGNILIGIDRDADALRYSRERIEQLPVESRFYRGGFETITEILDQDGVKTADAFLMDLGFSSPQIDTAERGFSFMKNGPLDMRMGRDQLLKAEDIVNQWDEQEMAEIFMKYGDERFSRRIAKAIVRRRNTEPILTTQDLADTVIQAIPEMNRYTENIHPATRVFQALRIVVNDELGALRTGLQGALERLRPNGRIAVLSYHSLEHRIVKELFKNFTGVNAGPPGDS